MERNIPHFPSPGKKIKPEPPLYGGVVESKDKKGE
jgi:hypothetical protein